MKNNKEYGYEKGVSVDDLMIIIYSTMDNDGDWEWFMKNELENLLDCYTEGSTIPDEYKEKSEDIIHHLQRLIELLQ